VTPRTCAGVGTILEPAIATAGLRPGGLARLAGLERHVVGDILRGSGATEDTVRRLASVEQLGDTTRAALLERLDQVQVDRTGVCAMCGEQFEKQPKKRLGTYCPKHARIGRGRGVRRPISFFRRYLFDRWRASQRSLSAFARGIGLSDQTLRRLLDEDRDSHPTTEQLEQLRARYGAGLPSIETANERRSRATTELHKKVRTGEHDPFKQHRKRQLKQPSTDVEAAALRAARSAAGKKGETTHRAARRLDGGRLWWESGENRADWALNQYLRRVPSPSEKQLREWAGRVAVRQGLCIGEVIAWWNRRLKVLGVGGIRGNPPNVDQCRSARKYLAAHAWTFGRDRDWGYWKDAPVTQSECNRHAKTCPALERAMAGSRGWKTGPKTEAGRAAIAAANRRRAVIGMLFGSGASREKVYAQTPNDDSRGTDESGSLSYVSLPARTRMLGGTGLGPD
jgi:hypothetical protein